MRDQKLKIFILLLLNSTISFYVTADSSKQTSNEIKTECIKFFSSTSFGAKRECIDEIAKKTFGSPKNLVAGKVDSSDWFRLIESIKTYFKTNLATIKTLIGDEKFNDYKVKLNSIDQDSILLLAQLDKIFAMFSKAIADQSHVANGYSNLNEIKSLDLRKFKYRELGDLIINSLNSSIVYIKDLRKIKKDLPTSAVLNIVRDKNYVQVASILVKLVDNLLDAIKRIPQDYAALIKKIFPSQLAGPYLREYKIKFKKEISKEVSKLISFDDIK